MFCGPLNLFLGPMKKLFFVVCLLILPLYSVFACSCANVDINNRYLISDFIGVVEIEGLFDNEENKRFYTANLREIETFKGTPPAQIKIGGTVKESYSSQCEVPVRKGEQWLIYIDDRSNTPFILGQCDGPIRLLDEKGNRGHRYKTAKHYMEQLRFFREHAPDIHSKEIISTDRVKLFEFLKSYEGRSFEQSRAHYLIHFNTDLQVTQIKVLDGFSETTDDQIINFLSKEAEWYAGYFTANNKTTIESDTQYIFTLYHSSKDKTLSHVYYER